MVHQLIDFSYELDAESYKTKVILVETAVKFFYYRCLKIEDAEEFDNELSNFAEIVRASF